MPAVPFTYAHPAAVLPLRRYCPRYLVWSGLIVGSLSPDAWYFAQNLLLNPAKTPLHWGLTQDIVVGLLAFGLWHVLLKRPAVLLLPRPHREVLWPAAAQPLAGFFRTMLRLLPSLLIGAILHRSWDCFTHQGAWCVERLPFLQRSLLHVGSYNLRVTRVLQHASTFVGLGVILWAYLAWRKKQVPNTRGPALDRAVRLATLLLMGLIIGLRTVVQGARYLALMPNIPTSTLVVQLVLLSLSTATLVLMGWSLLFWLLRKHLER